MAKKGKITFIAFTLCCLCSATLSSYAKDDSAKEAGEIRDIISKVNGYWQAHEGPEVNAFWQKAVYETGNMEAYFLTGDKSYLEYATKWAEHNGWSGAGGKDKSKWLYKNYGESQEHVLFGDWQVCFQTYLDLYRILPDDSRISRAKEVMEYEISLDADDFWWWCDALYMVMPVMTKLYRTTGDERYLDKLYEYVKYTDSLMLDEETGLYYRDAKYVYPDHKTDSGRKDFWARGDGWVLAGLAKVLQDMPAGCSHHPFFVEKFRRLAEAVADCQQDGGYWTRSLYDPEQAPGPETSGTALFAYGLMWGVNNGYLEPGKYLPAADKAWKYLKKTALQKDGSVGYVQPIGERAIPGQELTASSQADFGVGAFLLAACERVRHLEKSADREYWCKLAWQMSEPVLSRMAEGRLQSEMLVETSPSWDGRNKKVTYMETFGRLMAGIAPWLALPDDGTEEGRMRAQLREWALESYANAVNPDSPDCLLWSGEGQVMVDAAYIAESFIRAYDVLWMPLDNLTKKRYIDAFVSIRSIDPPYTNWLLFSSIIESFLAKAGGPADIYRVNSTVRKMEEWYVGDGWYSDGPEFAFNYYNSYVFHPMYLETLQNMIDANAFNRIHYRNYLDRAMLRCQKYSLVLERFISPEGTFPVFGRSIPYRMAALQPLAMMAWYDKLPAGLTPGQVRSAITAVMHSMYDGKENYNERGYLTIGFCGRQPNVADWYTNNGSLYMTSLAFLPLGLRATHPFWTDAAAPWTSAKAWSGEPFPKDHQWIDHRQFNDLY